MRLLVRRVVIALAAAAAVFACAFHTAKATFDERALEASRTLFTFLEADHRGATRTLMLNGARLDLDSGHTDLSLREVLDAAARSCAERSGGIAERIRELKDRTPQRAAGLTDGVLRVEQGSEGLLACLTPSDLRLSIDELQARFTAFAKDGDLATLGGVQLIRAEKQERGVFFVTVRSVGSVPLWRMFPEHQDAPGMDFEEVPRPTGSRRVFSTWKVDGAPALNIYEAAGFAEQAYEKHAEVLRGLGYEISGQTEALEDQRASLFIKGSHAVVLAADASASKTWLTLMPLSAGPGMAVSEAHASNDRFKACSRTDSDLRAR